MTHSIIGSCCEGVECSGIDRSQGETMHLSDQKDPGSPTPHPHLRDSNQEISVFFEVEIILFFSH